MSLQLLPHAADICGIRYLLASADVCRIHSSIPIPQIFAAFKILQNHQILGSQDIWAWGALGGGPAESGAEGIGGKYALPFL